MVSGSSLVAFDSHPATRKRILIVDDSKLRVFLLQRSLAGEDYEISSAETGEEAIEHIRQENPDLVLLDQAVSGMDEYEPCRKIRAYCEEMQKFIPVVLLTANDSVENKIAGLKAGVDDYLIKPVNPDELLARVRSMLRIKDLQEKLLQTNQKLQSAQEIIERELNIVGEIQRSFLPSALPKHPRLDISASYRPSDQAGGDYYDIIEVGENHLGTVMADVTGHGASAAVVMAVTHLLMRSFVNTFKFPSTALKVVNEKLNAHLSSEHYVTMFYGILDTRSMQYTFSSAGHIPMFQYRAKERCVVPLTTEVGFPLRSRLSDDYDEAQISLEMGDKILLFTDGIVETLSRDREVFGEERLAEVLLRTGDRSAQETVDELIQTWELFRGDAPMRDDLTILVIRYVPD
ncbi:MAG TPA: SpoIIE family protein phosphatase [bacterium]|nr:SpoIIE family protein phosphatase [bacterium]HQP97847.1 SpoIIE family protein phosphatase [bacterium]